MRYRGDAETDRRTRVNMSTGGSSKDLRAEVGNVGHDIETQDHTK